MMYLPWRPQFVWTCLALVAVAACERSEEAIPAPAAQARAKHQAPLNAESGRDLVTAVSSSTGEGAVELKFNLKQHPQVGQAADLELVLTPTINLQRLYATFQVSEGLELRSGAEITGRGQLEAGTRVEHLVTFVPKREGIFHVSAVVVSDAQDTSTSRAYSIPVIAGAGIAPAVPSASTSATVAAQSASAPVR